MSTEAEGQQGGPGLGHSTPLVTIQGPGSIARGIAVPAGDNHPLAATSLATPAVDTAPTNQTTAVQNDAEGVPVNQTPPRAVQARSPSPLIPQTMNRTPRPSFAAPPVQARVVSAMVSPTLDALADAFLSERSYRTDQLDVAPLLRPVPLPREEGIYRLRTLVERRAWGDVLKVCTSMLNSQKDLHADVYASLVTLPLNAPQVDASKMPPQIRQETVEIMTLQCHAWLKLRRYSDLATEVERWNFVAHNDATARSPEWLPWSIHILAAQVQQYTDDAGRASDVLFELRDRIPKEDAIWLVSVDNALANLFLRQGQWRLALGSFDRIIKLIPAATKAEVRSKYPAAANQAELESVLTIAYKCEILSRQGRTLLQVGALPQVAQVFESAKALWSGIASVISPDLENHAMVHLVQCQMDVNEALFYFAKSNHEQANESFSRAVDLLRKEGSLAPKYNVEDWMGPTVAGGESSSTLYSECINNMSLCALYTCRMKDAIQLLEGVIREDPTAFLTERVVFNICTLYELGSDSAASARKKRVLQLIAKRFFLHDVGPESFRVT